LERRLDGGGDELRGLRVDGDVPAEQHAADDMAGVAGRVLRAVGLSALFPEVVVDGGAVHADGLGDLGDGVLPLRGGQRMEEQKRQRGCTATGQRGRNGLFCQP